MAGPSKRLIPDNDAKWQRQIEERLGKLERDRAGGGASVSGVLGKFAGTYGDGTATTITVHHNLSTEDLSSVTIRDIASGEVVYTKWVVVDENTIDVILNPPAAANSKRITVRS